MQQREQALRHRLKEEEVRELLAYLRRHRLPTGDRQARSSSEGSGVSQLWRLPRHAVYLALKETPLLLAVLFVVFVTGEAWQFFGRLHDQRFLGIVLAFVAATFLALLLGLRRERLDCYRVLESVAEEGLRRREAAFGKPTPESFESKLEAEGICLPEGEIKLPKGVCRQIGALEMARLCFNVAAVGLASAAFFVVLGIVAIDEGLTEAWITRTGEAGTQQAEIWHVPLVTNDVILSDPLLRVAAVLGAFAALTFAVRILTDENLRSELVAKRLKPYQRAIGLWARLYYGPHPEEPATSRSAPATSHADDGELIEVLEQARDTQARLGVIVAELERRLEALTDGRSDRATT